MLIILLSNSFSDLPVALVGNFVFQQKRTFGERKHILRPPRTIPVAILLVEIFSLVTSWKFCAKEKTHGC
jgi:hypothetical protein